MHAACDCRFCSTPASTALPVPVLIPAPNRSESIWVMLVGHVDSIAQFVLAVDDVEQPTVGPMALPNVVRHAVRLLKIGKGVDDIVSIMTRAAVVRVEGGLAFLSHLEDGRDFARGAGVLPQDMWTLGAGASPVCTRWAPSSHVQRGPRVRPPPDEPPQAKRACPDTPPLRDTEEDQVAPCMEAAVARLGGSAPTVRRILAENPRWDKEVVFQLLRCGATPTIRRVVGAQPTSGLPLILCDVEDPLGQVVPTCPFPLCLMRAAYSQWPLPPLS